MAKLIHPSFQEIFSMRQVNLCRAMTAFALCVLLPFLAAADTALPKAKVETEGMKAALEEAKSAPIVVIKAEPMPDLPERKQFRIGTIKPIAVRMGTADAVATTKGAVVPQEIVDAHNKHRATVGVPPLAYSDELAASAQAWADKLKRSNQCRLKHSDTQNGENIFGATAWSNGPAQDVRSSEVIDAFASEKSDYTYSNNNCTPGRVCGHYTQVVWRNTTHVGCAMAMCDEPKDQVWVCQYNPPGNYMGQKPY